MFTVICEDNIVRHDQPFATRAEAQTFAEWGHCCTAKHDIRQGRTVEAGNLYVGDVVLLPGDLVGTIDDVDAMPATDVLDAMSFTTQFGSIDCRFSTLFLLIERPA